MLIICFRCFLSVRTTHVRKGFGGTKQGGPRDSQVGCSV